MPWKWKVHCKTQKKLKELSRLVPSAQQSNSLHYYCNIILEGGLLFIIILPVYELIGYGLSGMPVLLCLI